VSLLTATGIGMDYVRKQRNSASVVTAIADISLSVEEGQFVTLVGPSGCGKSTFLKIVDGLLTPSRGEIFLNGRPITESSHDRAMVFQEASLLPWYAVSRNVGYGLECQNVPVKEAAKRAQPYIELVGLKGFEGHYPHELSGGMQQRANLARALTVDPAILLMDEPFAALDAQTREAMQAELMRIWQAARKTVLFVTHQIDEALYLSDRVIVLSARPATIVEDITVDLPRPRKLEIKRQPAFIEYEDHIWRLIQAEARRRSTVEDELEAAGVAQG
jgi:NitT/TauT family transport system ATP-binding protein